MINAGIVLLTLGLMLWVLGIGIWSLEKERWPGTYLKWSVYQRPGRDGAINVGLRRRSGFVRTAEVNAQSPSFDDELIAAVAAAREKAILLNGNELLAKRRMP